MELVLNKLSRVVIVLGAPKCHSKNLFFFLFCETLSPALFAVSEQRSSTFCTPPQDTAMPEYLKTFLTYWVRNRDNSEESKEKEDPEHPGYINHKYKIVSAVTPHLAIDINDDFTSDDYDYELPYYVDQGYHAEKDRLRRVRKHRARNQMLVESLPLEFFSC